MPYLSPPIINTPPQSEKGYPSLVDNNFVSVGTPTKTPRTFQLFSIYSTILGVWKAPVWGAWKTNLNTIDENGFFSFQDNATGIPTGFTGVGVVLNTRQGGGSGAYGMQIAYGLNNSLQYIRESSDGTNWGGWRILYSQSILSNSTVLGELASALGGQGLGKVVAAGNLSTSEYNAPTNYGVIIKFVSIYNVFICVRYDATKAWVGGYLENTQTVTWREITLTAIS